MAYEMRICDWSSDVCSSDLPCLQHDLMLIPFTGAFSRGTLHVFLLGIDLMLLCHTPPKPRTRGSGNELRATHRPNSPHVRSEDRRGGKECVSTVGARGSPYHYKQTTQTTDQTIKITQ